MDKLILRDIRKNLLWYKKNGFIRVYEDTEEKLNDIRVQLAKGRIKAEKLLLEMPKIHTVPSNVRLKSVTINGKTLKYR